MHLREQRPPILNRNPTTSFLTATTLIYAIGAGITAAAGTRLALQWIVVKRFKFYSFQQQNVIDACFVISCHYLPMSGLGNLRACCLPQMWQPFLGLPLRNRTLILRYPSMPRQANTLPSKADRSESRTVQRRLMPYASFIYHESSIRPKPLVLYLINTILPRSWIFTHVLALELPQLSK